MEKSKNKIQKKRSSINIYPQPMNIQQGESEKNISERDHAQNDSKSMKRLSEQQQKNIITILNKYGKQLQMKGEEQDIQNHSKRQQRAGAGKNLTAMPYESICRGSDFEVRGNISDLSIFRLQRIQIDPTLEHAQRSFDHEVLKLNQLTMRLEQLINKYQPQAGYKLMANFAHFINSMILTTNFMITKLAFQHDQIIQTFQQTELVNCDLRAELHHLQSTLEILKLQVKDSQNKQTELHRQISRLRSVVESYQGQNFQLKNQLQILRQVIQQMNVQVEKGEKKFNSKSKQLIQLQNIYERLVIYSQQLQMEVREHLNNYDEGQNLKKLNDIQEMQVKKWKQRCFMETQKYNS